MGGIAGFLALDELSLPEGATLLSRMLDGLAERGLRGRKTASSPDFGVGAGQGPHPDGTSNPYRSPRGDFVLGLDGLPRVLGAAPEDPGPALRTLYLEEDVSFLARLDGAFSLAVWDDRLGRLCLARDAFGQRPLYVTWARGGRTFLFSSELKGLLASGIVPARIDGRCVLDVLSMGHPLPPRTLVTGVRQLPPGSWLCVDRQGREQQGRWYELPYPRRYERPRERRGSWATVDQALRSGLSNLGERVGCALPGEAEATLLAAGLCELRSGVRVFTAAFDEPGAAFPDVPSMTGRIAERLEAEHVVVKLAPIGAEETLGVLRALEVPSLDAEPFFESQVYTAAAADGRSGLVSAVGARALFAAAVPLGDRPMARALRGFVAPWTLRRVAGLARALRGSWRAERVYARRWGAVPAGLERWFLVAHIADSLFARRLRPPLGPARFPLALSDPPLLIGRASHRQRVVELRVSLAGKALWQGDRLAARVGIERHLPFLDRGVVERTVALLPKSGALSAAAGQYLPRSLSGPVRRRGPRPFRHPNPVWPFGPGTPGWIRDLLSTSSVDEVGLFEPSAVTRTLEGLASGRTDAIARLEARVLLGVVGFQALARTLRLTDIDWPGDGEG